MQALFSAPSPASPPPPNLALSNYCGMNESVIPYKHTNKMMIMIMTAAKAYNMGHVPGISLNTLHNLTYLILTKPYEVGIIIVSFL